MKHITLIDYGAGNLRSVEKVFEQVGAKVTRVTEPNGLVDSDLIVLPGQGHFGQSADSLSKNGLAEALTEKVMKEKTPYLGLCLGLQLLFETSEEAPEYKGLGWFKGSVKKFESGLKIPHMGWNEVEPEPNNADSQILFTSPSQFFYFVHSYVVLPEDDSIVLANSVYRDPFVCAVSSDNIVAVQFHPEKSQENGIQFVKSILKKFQ